MRRTVILVDDRDNTLGSTVVAEATVLIVCNEGFFMRTDRSRRLSGGGLGVVFAEVDPAIRMKLTPV